MSGDPDKDLAFAIAAEAVKHDNAGDYLGALPRYKDALGYLLSVIKRERNPAIKKQLVSRMDGYMKRAELIKKLKDQGKLPVRRAAGKRAPASARPPAAPAATAAGGGARAKHSTARSYFRADTNFKAHVAYARKQRAAIEAHCAGAGTMWTDPKFKPNKAALVGAWGAAAAQLGWWQLRRVYRAAVAAARRPRRRATPRLGHDGRRNVGR